MGMSHFAGLYSLVPGAALPARLSQALAEGMRSWGVPLATFEHPDFVLHHAGHSPGGPASAQVGHLVLDPGTPAGASALERVRHANGTFALAEFDPAASRLVLATDSLGARPLYWTRHGEILIFSTSIRLIAALPGLRFEVDWPALAEQAAFCYPLASRTPLAGVQVLRDGEALIATPNGLDLTRYHRWEETPLVEASAKDHAAHCHAAFLAAVRDRAPATEPVTTLLSGGLDSRCIAGALLDLGRQVHAWNLANDGWQDGVFAAQFAERAGIRMDRVEWTPAVLGETPGFTTMGALRAATSQLAAPETFSGDGGGETIGFLMMEPAVLALLDQGRPAEAFREYIHGKMISRRVIGGRRFRELQDAAAEGMAAEFDAMPGIPPQKAMQLFLLRNDMRRHLHDYFEYSESARTELLLPFYDRRVLESVIRIAPPFGDLLGHRFYYRWMRRFRAPVTEVPWQSYADHEPCPLPMPPDAKPQAQALAWARRLRARQWRNQVVGELWDTPPPAPLRGARLRLLIPALHSLWNVWDAAPHFKDYLWVSGHCRLAAGEPVCRGTR